MPVGVYQHKSTQGFQKKYTPYNKGRKTPEAIRLKISLANKGRKLSSELRKSISKRMLGNKNMSGKKHSEETKKKIREKLKGNKNSYGLKMSEDAKEKIRQANLGKKMSEETKQKISLAKKGKPTWWTNAGVSHPMKGRKGSKHPAWRGGTTPAYSQIRHCPEYVSWREAIFLKDNYTCVFCGKRGGRLNADHYPISFSAILNKLIVEQGLENLFEKALKYEMFWLLDNGRTLCVPCHKNTDTYLNRWIK